MWIMGYRHHGTLHYFNCNGVPRDLKPWGKFKDRMIGLWRGILKLKMDSFSDHNITTYTELCEK